MVTTMVVGVFFLVLASASASMHVSGLVERAKNKHGCPSMRAGVNEIGGGASSLLGKNLNEYIKYSYLTTFRFL